MANVTLRIAVILIFLGVIFFVITGAHVFPPLIPAVFGVVLLLLGLLARSDDAKRRMIIMHIAVTVGLIGFLVPAIRGGGFLIAWYGHGIPFIMREVQEQLLMAFICLVYVVLCVRSFIAVRRDRASK